MEISETLLKKHALTSRNSFRRLLTTEMLCTTKTASAEKNFVKSMETGQNVCASLEARNNMQTRENRKVMTSIVNSGGSWWNCPGGLRNFISGWTYGIVALVVFFINSGVSSHSSSPSLIKLVIFSCPYWYICNGNRAITRFGAVVTTSKYLS